MPQIILLNHAAWMNGKRSDTKTKDPTPTYNGKKIEDLDTDQFFNYLNAPI